MANIYRLIAFFLFLYPSISFATLGSGVGEINLAGWIKEVDGTYSRAFTNADGTSSKISLTSAPKGITTTSTALVQTSKGITAMDIVKTANVTTARLGPVMVGLAKKAGPIGLTLTAASLVCELTNICNTDGIWTVQADPQFASYPATTSYGRYIAGSFAPTSAPSPEIACAKYLTENTFPTGWTTELLNSTTCRVFNDAHAQQADVSIIFQPNICPANYTLSGGVCNLNSTLAHTATDTDWNDATSKLNDDRVTPHLIEAQEPLPTDSVPTLTPGQKKGLGLDSVPTRDSSGNITGREDTTTEIEAVDNGTSDKPGSVIIKETKTTVKYDNSNTQISSTTSTSYTNQPDTQQPSGFTISFDDVPEATLPTYNVPNTFSSTSWGSGTCPSNIDVTLSPAMLN
ncbi:MAG: hypothetical protein E6Q59_04830 [Nitrosomonas sp.]|nr:MAG: hypothetical protein E6Q59_04830 [Nitrosomonas sp.]